MWFTNSTAVQGRNHIKENIPCQDKVYTNKTENTVVIALADGAGSACLSHIGAEICVKTISNYFIDKFNELYDLNNFELLKKDIYKTLINSIKQASMMYNCSIKDLACTLLCIAIKNEQMISFHLGDGVIAYIKGDKTGIMSMPDNGEFANTTHFVTSSNATEHIRIQRLDCSTFDGFFLMSDGAGTSLYDPQKKIFSNALKRIVDLSMMYSEEDVYDEITNFFEQSVKMKTFDDCSIAFIARYKSIVSIFSSLSHNEQFEMLEIKKNTHSKKIYQRFLTLLSLFETEKSVTYISRKLHLKPKYCSKYICTLIECGLIKKVRNNVYINSNVPLIKGKCLAEK